MVIFFATVAGIFLVIFLFSSDILVEYVFALPIDLWFIIFIFFVVWGPRVVKFKKHKVSDSHPSLMGNYHKSYLHIAAIIRYDPRDEDSYQHFHQKKFECTILANLSVFEIVFATSIVLYHHCCAALSCIATLLLYCYLCCVCL